MTRFSPRPAPVRKRQVRLGQLLILLAGVLVLATGSGQGLAASPTPPVTAGLQLWYEAETTAYADGQSVTNWTDKSGFGRDLAAFDPGQAATMRRNAVNGRAAIEFNGSTSLLKTYGSTFTLSQPNTFFIVYRSLDANTSSRAFVFDSRNSAVRQVFGRPGAGQERMYANIDLDVGGFTYPFPAFAIFSGTFNGSNSALYEDGTLVAQGNAGSSGQSGFSVGGLSTSGQYGYDMTHVMVAEILYYNGALSTADRQAVTSWLDEKYSTSGPPTPPANTTSPAITGSATDGSTVTASTGAWSGSAPISYAYQWRACDAGGDNCADVTGETGSTYTVRSSDVGSTLRVVVTASNSAGSAAATSAPTAVVAAAPPQNTSLPGISGSAVEGATLTASTGSWNGTTPIGYAYQWRRCDNTGAGCASVSGETSSTYELTSADVGSTVRVVVTASNGAGSNSAASQQSLVVSSSGSGGVPSAPPVTAGLQIWFEANTQPIADGQGVARWVDQSGNGRDLTAFDEGAAPVLRRNAVNGRAAIEFNGTNSLLKTYESTFTISQPDTFFIVYKSLDVPGGGHEAYVFDSRNASVRQTLGLAASGNSDIYADIDLQAAATFPFPNYQIWSGTFNGSASSLWRNGAQVAAGSTGGSGLSGFTVGALSTSGQYGYLFSHSLVAEILLYNGALSSSNRQAVTDWLNQKYDVTAPVVPPANTAVPTITGTARDGSTLTTSNGSWSGTAPFTYGYQWARCDSSGTSCVNIGGATSASYTATPTDVGSTLVARVTASNGAGSASATSAPTAVVAALAPSNTALPTITGTAQEGQTLAATNGTWNGTPPLAFSYSWQRCNSSGAACSALGVTAQTYTAVTADVGSTLRVAVTASNGAGNSSATSAQTAVVAAAGSPPGPDTPPVTAGLQLWYDANTQAYNNGQAVTRWTDASGLGRDLTAFTAGAAPTMRKNAVNGRAAIEFNGTNSLLKTYGSTFTIAQPDTFFIVYKSLDVASPGAEAYVFDSRNSSVRQLLGLGPFTNTEMYADIDIEAPTAYPFPNYQIWSGTYQGSSSTVWKNNVQIASGPAGGASLSGFTVGGLSTSGEYGYLLSHSLVAEILFYSGSMSLANRQAVTNWLNQKYALY